MSTEWMRVQMRHRVGALRLDVAFGLSAPWTILFGASGSGKTTILRTIAGFVRPDAGHVELGEIGVADTATGAFVPPSRRRVRSAGQAAKLFPRMSVRENLLYGAGPARPPIEELAAMFHVEHCLGELPVALSGGERQRVSVARAVLSAVTAPDGPVPLLLDEPFTGLDFALRDQLAVHLRDWLGARRVPVLSVTHDVGEAFLLAAEVIRLDDGHVVDQGQVERVLAEDRSRLLLQLDQTRGAGIPTQPPPP